MLDSFADQSLVSSLTDAWKAARVVEHIRLEHLPPLVAAPAPRTPSLVATKPKARAVPPASLVPKPFRALFASQCPASVKTAGDDRQMLLDLLFQVACATGSHNVRFGTDLTTCPERSRLPFERSLQPVPTEALHAHRRAFKRWTSYHAQHCPSDVPYWMPTPLQLSGFFSHISRGGPTAAKGVFSSLKWWREHVGVPFPVFDGLVQHWGVADQSRCVSPKPPLSVVAFFAIAPYGSPSIGCGLGASSCEGHCGYLYFDSRVCSGYGISRL